MRSIWSHLNGKTEGVYGVVCLKDFIIIVVIIMWTGEKPSEKKKTLTSQLSGSLIGSNGLIYSKSRAWCHSFQPIKEHY